ncbi:hypothetical protein DFH09DRAFT_1275428 [Mycena vulgaris]|nr:hypothetical protein DFH09DRAFT_1275428 [Mycena vulgaris]
MPPRTRARKSHSKTDVVELASRSAVRLPQELIDVILDEFDPSLMENDVFPDRTTLRFCALVARAFVRPSQANLFSTVNLCTLSQYHDDGHSVDERPKRLSKLLSSKPHVRSYIRTLLLSYQDTRSNSVAHILSSLPKLKRLSLHPLRTLSSMNFVPEFPIQLRDSFLAVFSTSSLRRLELRYHQFENTQHLQQTLSNSRGLKELILMDICFADLSSPPSEKRAPTVVLEYLEVVNIQQDTIEAILNSFTLVDITHLRSISCDRYHVSLLQANAHSIQKLTLSVAMSTVVFYPGVLDQILPLKTSLRSLNLSINNVHMMASMLARLGNLGSLESLKELSITTSRRSGLQEWARVDPQLARIGSQLDEILIGLTESKPGDEAELRLAMPILDAKGVLRFFPASVLALRVLIHNPGPTLSE